MRVITGRYSTKQYKRSEVSFLHFRRSSGIAVPCFQERFLPFAELGDIDSSKRKGRLLK